MDTTITKLINIVGGGERYEGAFDIRKCPVWAIPQLALVKRRFTNAGINAEFFELGYGNGFGKAVILVEGRGIFYFGITKWGMNSQEEPKLYPMVPIIEPTPELKVGDKVRSKSYGIEGVIQDIGPCDSTEVCDRMMLTLDPPGKDSNGNGNTRFYYHTDTFEVVSPE